MMNFSYIVEHTEKNGRIPWGPKDNKQQVNMEAITVLGIDVNNRTPGLALLTIKQENKP